MLRYVVLGWLIGWGESVRCQKCQYVDICSGPFVKKFGCAVTRRHMNHMMFRNYELAFFSVKDIAERHCHCTMVCKW